MIIDAQKFTKREGYLEASASTKTVLAQYSEFAKNYKKKLGFQLVDGAKILDKISGENFCVSRKLDGELQVVFVRDGEVFMSTSGGKIRTGLPCLNEVADLVKKS